MKKTILLILIASVCTVSAAAQTRTRYVFDNFDTSTGVKIYTPSTTTTAKTQPKKTTKTTTQNTSKDTVYVQKTAYIRVPNLTMAGGNSLSGFTTGNPEYDRYVEESCRRYNVDPLLIYAQMHQESSFKLRAISNKGARGLMQLMPATAVRFGVTDIYDPKQNIDAGVRYMRWLLNTFNGDVELALAGYNAGEGAVMKYGNAIPPYRETQEYVKRITARYNAIKNPNLARNFVANTVYTPVKTTKTSNQKAVTKPTVKTPTTEVAVYKREVFAMRTADGKLQLVNR
jgi:hypothetical protein